ncbi:cytochrome c biogenesis protein ResB [Chungangia koreensis]|uniref:Cytochrome c biogenesis protein ResB n=1 Tax=Chungangia koreensis TaxID=752657 RepID=A0ABV8X5D7_9LACT
MAKILCECGHENPQGTVLCENCGRPLTEEAKTKEIADMRYEGTARRSQTYNRTIIDKVWNFFSSVKVGVTLIVIILVAAALGTFLPQVLYVPATVETEIAKYYEETYGIFGQIYYGLGLHEMYRSWWFQALIGMLAISLVVASLDRGIPLFKSLKNQRVVRHESFMKRQRLFGRGQSNQSEKAIDLAEEKLKTLRYKVKRDGNALLAEKGRFSRWGPYVNHTGLIIFLFGVMLRILPGFYVDETLWIREGETRAIPGAPGYYLHSEEFTLETYSTEDKEVYGEALERVGTVPKNFQTDVTLFKKPEGAIPGEDNLEKVKEDSIIVNDPLKFDGYAVYQMDYSLNELKAMTFQLTNKESGESLGEFTIDLINPEKVYDLGNGAQVRILNYAPDFSGFKNGVPQTKTPLPNNPAFLVEMKTPDTPEGESSFVAIRETLEPLGENQYKLSFQDVETRDASGLVIRKDKTLWILGIGGLIFLLGVAQGSYWNHRRFWIQKAADGTILVAGHTNKNWFALRKELDAVTEYAKLPAYTDQQDPEFDEKDKDGED